MLHVKDQITEKRRIGNLGEDIACRYLESKGLKVISRNYRKFYGEIDIIAKKGERLFFVEVKSVTRENVTRGTLGAYRPEDNLHPWKLKRLFKTIGAYLTENRVGDSDWQLDALIVYLDLINKKAKIDRIENIGQ
jgi:putative endonuclease